MCGIPPWYLPATIDGDENHITNRQYQSAIGSKATSKGGKSLRVICAERAEVHKPSAQTSPDGLPS